MAMEIDFSPLFTWLLRETELLEVFNTMVTEGLYSVTIDSIPILHGVDR